MVCDGVLKCLLQCPFATGLGKGKKGQEDIEVMSGEQIESMSPTVCLDMCIFPYTWVIPLSRVVEGVRRLWRVKGDCEGIKSVLEVQRLLRLGGGCGVVHFTHLTCKLGGLFESLSIIQYDLPPLHITSLSATNSVP